MSLSGEFFSGAGNDGLDEERDDSIRLELEEGEIILTPDTAELIGHIDEYAVYNHIYYYDEGESNYLFEKAVPDVYGDLVQLMTERNYPERRNVRAIGAVVLNAFDQAMCQDIEQLNTLPAEWTTDT